MTLWGVLEATVINQTNPTVKLGKYPAPVVVSVLGGCLLLVLVLVYMTPHINHYPFFLKRFLRSLSFQCKSLTQSNKIHHTLEAAALVVPSPLWWQAKSQSSPEGNHSSKFSMLFLGHRDACSSRQHDAYTEAGFDTIQGNYANFKLSPGQENGLEYQREWKGKKVRTSNSTQPLFWDSGLLNMLQLKQDGKVCHTIYLCPGS